VASTTASLSWSFQYEIQWSPTSCLFRITHIDSAARFHPESSWVRPGHQTTDVLQHEQGHFDIAEIYKVAFEGQTQDLVNTSRECRGRSERQANQNAERELSRLIGSIYDDVWQQFQTQQNAYDTETRHGIDADAQARWTRKIADSLRIGN
jgi:hypothetical protein